MSWKYYYSQRSLIKSGRKLAPSKDIISFDLFDTLLVRRIHDPDLVKNAVAGMIAELARPVDTNWNRTSVQVLRDTIEAKHRRETGQRFDDHEACYPRYMEEVLRDIFGACYTAELLERVTAYELEMENSMLVPRQELCHWLGELAAAGKRIFIISDMYLPAGHLQKLVEHAGLAEQVEVVISSADTFLAKASGNAYPYIAEKYDLGFDSWLHVGDNPISDGLRASEAGIDALVLADPREDQRKSIVKRYYNYCAGKPFWRGRLLQQLMAPLEAENEDRDELYIEGYNFLGPLIGIFIQRMAQLCRKNEISKIFFLSREGWTFKKYWEESMPLLGMGADLPEIEYLYVSRMALAGATCAVQGLTRTNAGIAFLPPGNRDFRDVCRIFSLDPEKFISLLKAHNLRIDTCLSHVHDGYMPENRRHFDALLEDENFQKEVRRQTVDQSLALQRYLEDVGFFSHKKVAIVDIGWLGTIQRFLYEAVAHREDCPVFCGYLFGATRGIEFPTSEKNSIEGIIYDRKDFDFAASNLFYARDVFEEACRAPYPTLNGYRLDGDGYQLVFRQTDDSLGKAELDQDKYFAPLQQGIFDSARRFGAASALLGYELADYKAWLNYLLISKLAFPKTREIARIRNQHHLDDFHGAKKPKADFGKGLVALWDRPFFHLRFYPFLRLRYFLSHLRGRINE